MTRMSREGLIQDDFQRVPSTRLCFIIQVDGNEPAKTKGTQWEGMVSPVTETRRRKVVQGS